MLNLFGNPKAGKSFLALGIAEAITTGKSDYLGLGIGSHGPVAYLQIDTPRGEWHRRLNKAKSENFNFNKILFADMQSGTPFPFNIISDWQALKQQLDLIQPVLLIIDTLREVFRGDENDSSVMQNVVAHVAMAKPQHTGVMLLSHRRKETQFDSDDLLSSARGSNYIAGRMDGVMYLTRKELRYVSRSMEEQSVAVFQHPFRSGKSGMVFLDPEEDRMSKALELIATTADEKSLGNMSELGRRLCDALGGVWCSKELKPDAARKHVERKLKGVLEKLGQPLILA